MAGYRHMEKARFLLKNNLLFLQGISKKVLWQSYSNPRRVFRTSFVGKPAAAFRPISDSSAISGYFTAYPPTFRLYWPVINRRFALWIMHKKRKNDGSPWLPLRLSRAIISLSNKRLIRYERYRKQSDREEKRYESRRIGRREPH